VQRHVLYLGEINSSQELAWRKSIEVLDEDAHSVRSLSLFPDDHCTELVAEDSIVRLRLSQLQLYRPRQWGACWLALTLWEELQLDTFWTQRLPSSRKGTRWDQVLMVLVAYRLIEPGSEWRLHRHWYGQTALGDLLGTDETVADSHTLYACHDRLLQHKEALFSHLIGRWRDLFNVSFDVLLYDLTSTYFESDAPLDEEDKRRHGYSRDHRPDCVQIVIALVVTPEGLPLAYEVLPGNTVDSTTLRAFLARIERQYGKARRVWCMDRGIPTEAVLAEMRANEPPVQYLVGTPKGRLTRLEQARTVCVRAECGPDRQGTLDAPPPTEVAMGAAGRIAGDEADPRWATDEARQRAVESTGGVAADRERGDARRHPQLSTQPRPIAQSPPPRRPLPVTHQSHRD
jgi:Transposase DDE domain